jgi:threonine synthase
MSQSPDRWARCLKCSATGEQGELDQPAFLSPAGAPWLVDYDLQPERAAAFRQALAARPWTLWRYRELLPVRSFEDRVDLGEGGTPLVRLRRLSTSGAQVWLKDESGNPTGSFKARGLSLAVNRALELGAPGVQLPSAGNAALALAAYAAAAGLPGRVAVPSDTPQTVIERCRAYGTEVLLGGDDLVQASRRLAERDDGYWDLSTLKEPYRVEGKKTLGLELAEQLGWNLPDWILYPTGGGTGIVGMHKAFDELESLGLTSGPRPRFAVVQMAGCAPIVQAFHAGAEKAAPWPEPRTRVWGLRFLKRCAGPMERLWRWQRRRWRRCRPLPRARKACWWARKERPPWPGCRCWKPRVISRPASEWWSSKPATRPTTEAEIRRKLREMR